MTPRALPLLADLDEFAAAHRARVKIENAALAFVRCRFWRLLFAIRH